MAFSNSLFFYSILLYSSILVSSQETLNFHFFDLPRDIQQEIVEYLDPSEVNFFVFRTRFVLNKKIAHKIIEHKIRAAYEKLDAQYDTCTWGWRDRCQTECFLEYKKKFFNQLKYAFVYESEKKKEIWHAAAQVYVNNLEKQHCKIQLPFGYPSDFPPDAFILSSPSLVLNFKEIYRPDIKHEAQTLMYLLLKALLLLDKIIIFTSDCTAGNFLTINESRQKYMKYHCFSGASYVKAAPIFNRCDKREIEKLISPRGWTYYRALVFQWIYCILFPRYSIPSQRPRLSSSHDWLL